MAWLQPKQEWLTSDYFLLDDWNRVVNNAKFLKELIGASFVWRDCSLPDTMSLPYYDLVNNLEDNLLDLCKAAGFSFIDFQATTWYARTNTEWSHNPSADDFMRWENLEYNLYYWYNITSKPTNVLKSGTFYAGTNRTTQLLSRGR